jgi:hypothetical protein
VSRGGAGDLVRGADGLSRGKVGRRATSWSLGGSGGDQRVVGDGRGSRQGRRVDARRA